jgi:hypothetical protein
MSYTVQPLPVVEANGTGTLPGTTPTIGRQGRTIDWPSVALLAAALLCLASDVKRVKKKYPRP